MVVAVVMMEGKRRTRSRTGKEKVPLSPGCGMRAPGLCVGSRLEDARTSVPARGGQGRTLHRVPRMRSSRKPTGALERRVL